MLAIVFKMCCLPVTRRRRRSHSFSHQAAACEERLLLSAVNVTTTPGPTGSFNVTFDGTEGDDQVQLGTHYQTGLLTAYSFNGTTFRLNGGPETSEVTFSSLSDVKFNLKGGNDFVSVFFTSVRDLRLNLGEGSDSAYITDANVRDVKIQDGVTDFEQNFYGIQSFASSFHLRNIEAEFDRGSSQISASALAGQSIELGEVEISGQNVQNVGLSLFYSTGSHVRVNGDVEIEVRPASFGVANISMGTQQPFVGDTGTVVLRKGIELHAPGGTLTVNGNTSVRGETDFTTTGFFNDRVSVESGAPVFEGKVNISTGEGDDYILLEKFDSSFPATKFHDSVSISTGGGNDIVNIGAATFAKSLFVDLGDSVPFSSFGVDNMRLGAVDISGKMNVTSIGEATVVIAPLPTSQAHFRKDASFTLGAGRVYVDSSDANVVFDKAQVFVGQSNRIQVYYIGNVIANLAKRTLTNADLFTF